MIQSTLSLSLSLFLPESTLAKVFFNSFILAESIQSWLLKLKESQLEATKASRLELNSTAESYSQAFKLYLKSAQTSLYLIKTTEDEVKKTELRIIANRLVERAERIKKVLKEPLRVNVKEIVSVEEQHLVLERSSLINGVRYNKWSEELDNKASNPISSILQPSLSGDQITSGVIWTKSSDILPSAKIVLPPRSGRNIEQDNISDCSLVAAFIIAEEHRVKFGSRIALSCLYPQDSNGIPKLSSTGVYNVRLLINGILRSIDDSLPTNPKRTELCCTSTEKQDELWPALIEKAYLKLMGGYGFSGSNSAVDLYALSGWIPEHLSPRDSSYRPDKSWNRLSTAFELGQCVLTLATGKILPGSNTCVKGLVPSHNYAILQMREIEGRRELEILNPWKAVKSESRSMFVDWETLASSFESIHLNWDPALHNQRAVLHASIDSISSLASTSPNSQGKSLQLRLRLNEAPSKPQEMWILLVRHQGESKNDDSNHFIGLEVAAAGQHLSGLSASFSPSSLTDDSCLLYRFNATPGISLYDIVVAYQGSNDRFSFTIKYEGFIPSSFENGPAPLPYQKSVLGKLQDRTAGGNHASRTYMNNPQYNLVLSALSTHPNQLADLKVVGKTDVGVTINVRVFRGGARIFSFGENDVVAGNADYSYGTNTCETTKLKPGNYTVVVSSFSNLSENDFSLIVDSTLPLSLTSIPQEGAGMYSRTLSDFWCEGSDGGNLDVLRNPAFLLMIDQPTKLKIRLQTTSSSLVPIGIYIFSLLEDGSVDEKVASTGIFSDAPCGILLETSLSKGNGNGYLVIPSTFTPGVHRDFQVLLYADEPVTFTVKQ